MNFWFLNLTNSVNQWFFTFFVWVAQFWMFLRRVTKRYAKLTSFNWSHFLLFKLKSTKLIESFSTVKMYLYAFRKISSANDQIPYYIVITDTLQFLINCTPNSCQFQTDSFQLGFFNAEFQNLITFFLVSLGLTITVQSGNGPQLSNDTRTQSIARNLMYSPNAFHYCPSRIGFCTWFIFHHSACGPQFVAPGPFLCKDDPTLLEVSLNTGLLNWTLK